MPAGGGTGGKGGGAAGAGAAKVISHADAAAITTIGSVAKTGPITPKQQAAIDKFADPKHFKDPVIHGVDANGHAIVTMEAKADGTHTLLTLNRSGKMVQYHSGLSGEDINGKLDPESAVVEPTGSWTNSLGIERPISKAVPTLDKLKLTTDEARGIREYTGGDTAGMQAMLRSTGPTGSLGSHVAQVDSVFSRAPALKSSAQVQRVVHGPENLFGKPGSMVGKKFTDKGYVSTTSNELGGAPRGSGIVKIHMPPGTKGLNVKSESQYKFENEVLLPRGSSFKVTRDVVDQFGRRHLEMTLLPPGS